MGPPQQRPNRNGLIIGGAIAAVLVVALGIGGVVFFLAGNGEEEPDEPLTLPTASAAAAPTTEPTAEPTADGPAPQPGDGPYVYVDDLCDQLDYQPVFDVLPYEDGPEESEFDFSYSQEKQCRFDLTDGSSFGNSGVTATVFADAESAQQGFESAAEVADQFNEDREDAEGSWDAGYFYYDTSIDSSVELLIKEDNLVLALRLFIAGDARDPDAQADALVALSENARAILRA